MSQNLFTSESVTEGHPDKIADQISDAVVDTILAANPEGRVACETLVAADRVVVAGEIATEGPLPDIPHLVRRVMREAGYERPVYGLDGTRCDLALTTQSPEIAAGVNQGGAGDQGMMFGFACADTPELMPAPISAAHALVRRLAEVRRSGGIAWLGPDGKSQVTYEYDGIDPVRINTVVVSTQHAAMHEGAPLSQDEIREAVIREVITPVLPERHFSPDSAKIHVNPSGSFISGGPEADAGLTGRKIIVDTYGGMGRHGGGAFSGKDATKVDRSGAYAARWAAKNTGCRRRGFPVRGAPGIRDRQAGARTGVGGVLRNRLCARPRPVARRARRVRLPARKHHEGSGAEGAGFWSDRGLRAFRPRAGRDEGVGA